jgi:nitroreductase
MSHSEILNLMKNRRSIRKFLDDPVPQELIEIILQSARWCQSASNRQPWRLILIKNKNLLANISKECIYGSFIDQAPIAIAIIAKKEVAPKWYIHDTSMLSHQICLTVSGLGLGTCWIGSMNRDKVASILELSKDEFVTTVLPIGFPKQKKIKPTQRKSLKEIVQIIE